MYKHLFNRKIKDNIDSNVDTPKGLEIINEKVKQDLLITKFDFKIAKTKNKSIQYLSRKNKSNQKLSLKTPIKNNTINNDEIILSAVKTSKGDKLYSKLNKKFNININKNIKQISLTYII